MMNVCAGSSTEPSVTVSFGAAGSTPPAITDHLPWVNVAVTSPLAAYVPAIAYLTWLPSASRTGAIVVSTETVPRPGPPSANSSKSERDDSTTCEPAGTLGNGTMIATGPRCATNGASPSTIVPSVTVVVVSPGVSEASLNDQLPAISVTTTCPPWSGCER